MADQTVSTLDEDTQTAASAVPRVKATPAPDPASAPDAKPDPKAPASTPQASTPDAMLKQQMERADEVAAQHKKDWEAFQQAYPTPAKPNLQPWSGKQPAVDPAREFGSWASVLGILAGALTRTPLTTALNASASAMNAIRSNDLAAYKDAKDSWEKNTDLAIKNADWEFKAYDDAYAKMTTNWAEGWADVKTTAAIAQNYGQLKISEGNLAINARNSGIQAMEAAQRMQIGAMSIQQAHADQMADLDKGREMYIAQQQANPSMPKWENLPHDQQDMWGAKGKEQRGIEDKVAVMKTSDTEKQIDAVMAAHPEMDRTKAMAFVEEQKAKARTEGRYDAAGTLTQDAVDQMAWQKLYTSTDPTRGLPANQKTQVDNQVTEIAKQYGMTPGQVAALPGEKRAQQSALAKLEISGAGVKRQLGVLDGAFQTAEKYRDQLSFSDMQRINTGMLTLANATGSGPAQGYLSAMQTLSAEYGKLMSGPLSNSQTAVATLNASAARINPGMSDAQFNTEREVVQTEAQKFLAANQTALDDERHQLETLPAPGTAGTTTSPAARPPPPHDHPDAKWSDKYKAYVVQLPTGGWARVDQ